MASVQRRLEFPVKKSGRVTRASAKENKLTKPESPRKRTKGSDENQKPVECSPSKQAKDDELTRQGETPTRGKGKGRRLYTPVNNIKSDAAATQRTKRDNPLSPVRDQRIPLSPCKPVNIPAPCSPLRPDPNKIHVRSPMKSPSVRRLLSPCKSPLCTKLIGRSEVRSPSKINKSSQFSCQKTGENKATPTSQTLSTIKEDTPIISKDKPIINKKLTSLNENTPTTIKDTPTVSKDTPTASEDTITPSALTPSARRRERLNRKSTPVLAMEKADCGVYHKAKQSFHTAKPERLIGREEELSTIRNFVQGHVTNRSAGSIYVSGAPGTGKTAVITHVLDTVTTGTSCKSMYLNCMTLKDSATVYGKVYTELTGKTPPSAKDRLRAVEKFLTSQGPSVIMVLDEIDQLDSKNQEILYTIFEWPSLAKSRLILLGIANALDLTDRILPRLQARPKCKPQLLNFAPYSKDQIAAILKDRMEKLEQDGVAVMEPSALQFCARKISAVAGDMRKALDVCRRAVEVVETQVRTQALLTSTEKSPENKEVASITRKIGIVQISSVLSEVYGSSTTTTGQEAIPLQQKLVVCTLLLLVRDSKVKEVTVGKLHDSYTKVCKKRQMAAMDYSEYQSATSLLESRGIIAIKKPKDGRLAKVMLKLNTKELEHALQDKVLVSSILQDGL